MTSRLFKAGQNSDVIEPDYLVKMGVLEYFPEENVYIKCDFCAGEGRATSSHSDSTMVLECYDCYGKGYIPYSDLV